MSYGSSIAPPITPNEYQPNNGQQNVIINSPAWYYLQAFARGCLSLPQSASEFTSRYGDFDVNSMGALVGYFQQLRDIGAQFGNPFDYSSAGSGYLQEPTPPADLMGNCIYSMAGSNGSMSMTAAQMSSFASLLAGIVSQLKGSDYAPNYKDLNQQLVLGCFTNPPPGEASIVDIAASVGARMGNLSGQAAAFNGNLGKVVSSDLPSILSAMITQARAEVSLDEGLIQAFSSEASALLDKYTKEMALVNWTRNPISVVPDVVIFGPFGGGVLFGISAIVGNMLNKDAAKVKADYDSLQRTIGQLVAQEGQKAQFIMDFSAMSVSLGVASQMAQSLCDNITCISNNFPDPGIGAISWGSRILETIRDINPDYFATVDSVTALVDLPEAITNWPQVSASAGEFQTAILPPPAA